MKPVPPARTMRPVMPGFPSIPQNSLVFPAVDKRRLKQQFLVSEFYLLHKLDLVEIIMLFGSWRSLHASTELSLERIGMTDNAGETCSPKPKGALKRIIGTLRKGRVVRRRRARLLRQRLLRCLPRLFSCFSFYISGNLKRQLAQHHQTPLNCRQ